MDHLQTSPRLLRQLPPMFLPFHPSGTARGWAGTAGQNNQPEQLPQRPVGKQGCRGVGQTDRQTDRLQCGSPALSLLPARVSLVHMPYAVLSWTLGLCAEASDRAHRRTTRVSLKRKGGGRIQVFSLSSCGSAALRVAAWSVCPP